MRTFSLLALASVASAIVLPDWTNFGVQQTDNTPVKTTAKWEWVDCGLPSDIVQIHSLTISPDPPEPGQNLTIKASGYVSERIEEGATADVTVKLGLVKLLQKRFDICEEASKAEADIQCPVEEGEHSVTQVVALPKEIPRAKFSVAVRAFSVDEEPLMCADIKIDFMKRPF